MFKDLFFYPVYALTGYIFLVFKFSKEEKRKDILKKQYDDSYAVAGKIILGQAFAGILAIASGGILILFVGAMIYRYLIKPLL